MITFRGSGTRTNSRAGLSFGVLGLVAGAALASGLAFHPDVYGAFMASSAFASPRSNAAQPAPSHAARPPIEDRDTQQTLRLQARKSRLEAESARADEIVFPAGFEALGPTAEAAADRERRFFNAKRTAGQNAKAQLAEKISQLRQDRLGLDAQFDAKNREVVLVREELAFVADMYERKLVNKVRLIGMQREVVRFTGEVATLGFSREKIERQIAELLLKKAEVDETIVLDAERELIVVDSDLSEFVAPNVATGSHARTGLARAEGN